MNTYLQGIHFYIQFLQELPYLPMRPYSLEGWYTLPDVVLTSYMGWSPNILDSTES